jgi:hemolysin activation/secretion protein
VPRRLLQLVAAAWLAFAAIATAPACAQPAEQTPRFEIRRFAVDGNTVLAAETVDAALAPYAGSARSFTDVQAAVEALQQLYVRAGFGAVQVTLPEQQLADGTVRITVVEPRLRGVKIEDNEHFDDVTIRRSLPALQEGRTPNTDALAAQIRLANENPARRLSVDLKHDDTGGIEATVTVHDEKPWKIGLAADNTGTPSTGRFRTGVFFQHANVADRDQVLTMQYVTSPDRVDDVAIEAINYRVPLALLGDSVDLFAIHADVDSGVVDELFNVRGRGSAVGVRYQMNLVPTASLRHRLTAGIERRVFDNQVGTVDGSPDLVPDVTARPANVGYAASWTGAHGELEAGATLVRNLPGGSHGHDADFAAVRSGARAGYSLLRWSLGATHSLAGDWQLRLSADGQATRDALISGEQFGVGGQDSVRGFYEREILNDKGARASVELRSPDVGNLVHAPGIGVRALMFYDVGRVTRNQPLAGEVTKAIIASAGVGVRISVAPSASARLDLAHVIRGASVRPHGDESAHFSIGIAY